MSFKSDSVYFTDGMAAESYSLENQIAGHLEFTLARDKITATTKDTYKAVSMGVRDKMVRSWLRTVRQYTEQDLRRVYYLSMEFLMGRLLVSALTNLDYYDDASKILEDLGYDLEEIAQMENDMGLGNGGLGRLAACFLDSMATLELPAFGYGIRYEYGIFKQEIENGEQVEKPDNWLQYGSPWEVVRPNLTYRIKFYGNVKQFHNKKGRLVSKWENTQDIIALAYDIPVPGYRNETVNNLRLWEAQATHEFDFGFFNQGDYVRAVENKNETENISKVLYPNDATVLGKELRLKQQYFFVSASLQDIIRKHKINHKDLTNFHEKNVIQLNDTHPAIAVPELMRLMLDEEGMTWDKAWAITEKTFAYTNHTVLSEALEKWSVPLFGRLLPRHLQIIYEINFRFLEQVKTKYHNDQEKIKRMSIIDESGDKKIRMASLAIVSSFSVNGVAELHTKILKDRIFRDYYEFFPEKFRAITNGITQRRWLKMANPTLSETITKHIGEGWVTDLYELRKLQDFINDKKFRKQWQQSKAHNKQLLIEHIKENYDIEINPNSMIDVQIKRLHEYKRQLLNVIHVIALYNRIKANPNLDITPRTVIFGGKAAPGYHIAKLIIKLINSVADVVNNDEEIGDKLKVVFMKNYSVSLAELIIPASDLSEQISTAGYEASGTGNMKFMLNGALTIGTLDGANIEMKEEVGEENMFIFGLTAEEVIELHNSGYKPWEYYESYPELREAIDLIRNNYFRTLEPGVFDELTDNLLYKGDRFCVMADFDAYMKAQDSAAKLFRDKETWTTKSILNVARSGKFSSDRTIRQYTEEIWKVEPFTPDYK